jgi:hypothetical protein
MDPKMFVELFAKRMPTRHQLIMCYYGVRSGEPYSKVFANYSMWFRDDVCRDDVLDALSRRIANYRAPKYVTFNLIGYNEKITVL